MIGEPLPLRLAERDALPVLVARRILTAELDAERLRRRALRLGDVRLKLDGVGAVARDLVDERMGKAEAAVVGEPDLGHDQAAVHR